MACCCERGNKCLGLIKGWKLLDNLSDYLDYNLSTKLRAFLKKLARMNLDMWMVGEY
jgi:hypothetical protein